MDGHAGEDRVPAVAPGVAVVVAGEDGHEARGGGDGLHKRDILAAVLAGAVVCAVRAPSLGLLSEAVIVIDAGLAVGINPPAELERLRGVGGNVDEGEGGDGAAVGAGKGGGGGGKPVDDADVDPVRLADPGAGGVQPLVVEAAAAVEEPQQQGRGAGGRIGAFAGVDGQVVVTPASGPKTIWVVRALAHRRSRASMPWRDRL